MHDVIRAIRRHLPLRALAAFVGLFLYTVLLTLATIGVDQLPGTFMATAYGAPVAAYALLLLARMVRALAALPISLAHPMPRHALPR